MAWAGVCVAGLFARAALPAVEGASAGWYSILPPLHRCSVAPLAGCHCLCSRDSSWPPHADDMAPRYRHSLQEKLELHAPAFRMNDVTFKSFQLQARQGGSVAGRVPQRGRALWGARAAWPSMPAGAADARACSDAASTGCTRAPTYSLNTLPSPVQDGLKRCVNAVDLVHAVTALLECGSRKGPVTNFGDHVDKFWWAACVWVVAVG